MRRGHGRTDARRGPRIANPPPAAIVAAGGRGDRALSRDAHEPKQFRLLGGRPLIAWSVEALKSYGCDPIVVVVPDDWITKAASLLAPLASVDVVAGGPTRQDSVANGLAPVVADTVVVHDAARPFATRDLVDAVVRAVDEADAAVAAVPVVDTLKRVSHDPSDSRLPVEETVDRATLWRAQTPAAFRTSVLKAAHERAAAEGFVGTDESQLVERYGGSIVLVRGSALNIKLTYPEDFVLAEGIVASSR